jgi:transposase
MPAKKYRVELTENERNELARLVKAKRVAAHKRLKAQVLLKVDQSAQALAWDDKETAQAFDVSVPTIERLRRRVVEEGLQAALQRREQQNRRPKKIDGHAEAHLIAVSCSQPPEGRARWTLQLLSERLVELKICESVSKETVRKTLKKTRSSRG